jgi:hypothetical protein
MPTLCVCCFQPVSPFTGAWYLVSSGSIPAVPLHGECRLEFEYEHMVRTEY